MNWLKIVTYIIRSAMEFLTAEQLKEFADMAFDFIEDKVQETDNPYDDAVALPIIAKLREAFNIPDLD